MLPQWLLNEMNIVRYTKEDAEEVDAEDVEVGRLTKWIGASQRAKKRAKKRAAELAMKADRAERAKKAKKAERAKKRRKFNFRI